MRRRLVKALVLAGASAAVSVLVRRRGRPAEHVDLYFEDGSMLSFARGSDEANRLLPLAGDVLAAARS